MKNCTKKRIAVTALALCLLMTAKSGLSTIEDTHHDMAWILGIENSEQNNICKFCHVPRQATKKPDIFRGNTTTAYGLDTLSSFCYNCHDGTVFPNALIEAPDGSVGVSVLKNSHGFLTKKIASATNNLETVQNLMLSGLVPLKDDGAEVVEKFTCDACHNVHSNDNPPFLRKPLESLCQSCHSGKDMMGAERWIEKSVSPDARGAHPIGMPVIANTTSSQISNTNQSLYHKPEECFDVPTYKKEDLIYIDVHWELGGHLLGESKYVTCATCHSAHMPAENLLVAKAAKNPDHAICTGCHGDGKKDEKVGAGNFYHPVFEESLPPYVHEHKKHAGINNPNVPIDGVIDLFVTIPGGFPLGSKKELLCTTCHVAHAAAPGTKCLRKSGKNVFCNNCHGTGEYTSKFNMHHPVMDSVNTDIGFPYQTGWYNFNSKSDGNGGGLNGDLTDGLQCFDCHSELTKGAHNW